MHSPTKFVTFFKINIMNTIVMRLRNNCSKLHKYVKLLNYSMYCTSQYSTKYVEVTSAYKGSENEKGESMNYFSPFFKYRQQNKNVNLNEIYRRMDEISQLRNTQDDYKQITTCDEFKHLCQMIQQNVQKLNSKNVFEMLSFLLSFKVPSDSVIMETLLQVLRTEINNLTVVQIINLHYKLSLLNETELIKGLLFAFPIVFENQIKVNLHGMNKRVTINALRFAMNIKSMQSIVYIVDILSNGNKIESLNDTISTLSALFLIPELNRSHLRLLDQMNDLLLKNSEFLTLRAVQFLFNQIVERINTDKTENPHFENLAHTLCHIVRNQNTSFNGEINILILLNKMQYKNISFMDHIAEKCAKDHDLLKNCTPYHLLHFVKSMNISSYKTIYWEILQPLIVDYILSPKCDFDFAVSLTYRLLSLGCYNEKLLEYIFSSCCLDHSVLPIVTMAYTVRLHQCVKTLYPEYQGVMLDQSFINSYVQYLRKTSMIIKDHLESIIGGDAFIRSRMKTKLEHYIDHVIVLKPDGSPMAIDNYANDTYIEDITVPSGCSMMVILIVPKTMNCRNSQKQQTTWELYIASIEKLLECTTVSINVQKWYDLSYNQKSLLLSKSLSNVKFCTNKVI